MMMMLRSGLVPLCVVLLGACDNPMTALADLGAEPDAARPVRRLDAKVAWHGDNAARLNELLERHAFQSPRARVVLDWDNTVVKNDVGDATLYWMLNNDKVLQPPARDWKRRSPFFTDAAAAALGSACGGLAEPGQPLPTRGSAACTDEILSVYGSAKTRGMAEAFQGFNHRRMEPAYALAAQVFAGYTNAEARAFADSAIAEAVAAPVGATQTLGTTAKLNGYVRYYDAMRDLIGALQDNGLEVFVVSASPQPVVEAAAARVGIAAEQVIGIRLGKEADGRYRSTLVGCGDTPEDSIIPFMDGKRCFANQEILGIRGKDAHAVAPAAQRWVFGAGDSDGDFAFLRDATVLKLVLNRNKPELMCNAYGNYMKRWLINPMWIEPRAALAGGYPCSKSACKDEQGKGGPCLDEASQPIPDQMDTVF